MTRQIVCREFVEASFTAFHTDPHMSEGRHSHTWRVRLYYPAEPFHDGRSLMASLGAILSAWEGQDLPPYIWSSADLATSILRLHGNADPLAVTVWRDDGPGAEAEFV